MVTSTAHPSGVVIAAAIPQSSAALWMSLMVALHAASVPQSSLSDLETYFLRKSQDGAHPCGDKPLFRFLREPPPFLVAHLVFPFCSGFHRDDVVV